MKLILGHNQFLGISHISESRASERDAQFSDPQRILETVRMAYDCGIRSMIVETHPRMRAFMELYEKDGTFDMEFILQVPHIAGYVRALSEGGVKEVVKEIISGVPAWDVIKTPFQVLPRYLRSDYVSIGVKGLDLEMSKYSKYDIKGVLLHNVISDVFLSYDAKEALEDYMDVVKRRFGVNGGLITLNLPVMCDQLREWGIRPSMVMSPINKMGFDMNPSKEEVERCITDCQYDVLAMNVMGGGAIKLSEAAEYLNGLKGLDAIVIGASSKKHMEELSERFLKN